MRIYDTPSRYHWEPDIDPFKEDKLIEIYGKNWKDALDNQELYEAEIRDFFYDEEKRFNI